MHWSACLHFSAQSFSLILSSAFFFITIIYSEEVTVNLATIEKYFKMDTAAKLNDCGEELTRRGSFVEALAMFRSCLQVLKRLVEDKPITDDFTKIFPLSFEGKPTIIRQDVNLFVHNMAMKFPTTIGEIDKNELINFCCTVVLFNIGLTNHLLGLSRQSKMPQYGRAASHLYKSAFSSCINLLNKSCLQESATLLAIVTLNNLGHVLHEMGRYQESRVFLNELQSFIVYVGYETMGTQLYDFFLNSQLLNEPRLAAAA